MTYYMGIDPGKTGGVCVVDGMGRIITLELLDVDSLYTYQHWFTVATAIAVERAQAMPGNGSVSMFNYGVGFGKILGYLQSVRHKVILVTPRVWTKEVLSGMPGEGKMRNVAAALKRQKKYAFIPDGCRKPHLGLVDAYLIAEWCRTQFAILK